MRELRAAEGDRRRGVGGLGVEATFEHITDRTSSHKYGLIMTPGLVLNEKLVCGGRVPSEAEVMSLIAVYSVQARPIADPGNE